MEHRQSSLRRRLIAGTILFLAGCARDPSAPVIADLIVEPAAGVRAGESLAVRLHYRDEDGDLGGGHAELALKRTDEPQGERYDVALSGDETVFGTLKLSVKLPVGMMPGSYEIAVTLIDDVGLRSNPLTGAFTVIE